MDSTMHSQTRLLALAFSNLIRDKLTRPNMAEVLRRNETYPANPCATQGFCDATMVMTEAFRAVLGREPDLSSDADAALWSAAWNLARTAEFPRAIYIVNDADGVRLFTIYLYDELIVDFWQLIRDALKGSSSAGEPSASHWTGSHLGPDHEDAPREDVADILEGAQTLGAAHSTISALRERYPDTRVWDAGGGHFSSRIDCDRGGYLVIVMSRSESKPPADDAQEFQAARFAADGGLVERANGLSMDELHLWIDAARDRARDPKNIADYFAANLGASSGDDSLTSLLIVSPCGGDCVKVIDAAAALIEHIHTAFGNDRRNLELGVIDIARQVIGVYRRRMTLHTFAQ